MCLVNLAGPLMFVEWISEWIVADRMVQYEKEIYLWMNKT